MTRSQRKLTWRYLGRRIMSGVVLVAYVAVAIGVPVPAYAIKDPGYSFPCQFHTCGCRTAEQCWRRCCCFSPEERFAWARAHHVEPPAYAEQPSSLGWNTIRQRDLACAHSEGPCACGKNHEDKQVPAAKSARTCCSAHAKSEPCTRTNSPAPAGTRLVLVMGMLHCQGLASLMILGGLVLPPPPPTTWAPAWCLDGMLTYPDVSAPDLVLAPLDPPPRSTAPGRTAPRGRIVRPRGMFVP
jgi:hypothetical protein